MNNCYSICIIGNGDEEEAKAIAQSCADNLAAAGHQIIQATVSVDRGGQHELITAKQSVDARAEVEKMAIAEGK